MATIPWALNAAGHPRQRGDSVIATDLGHPADKMPVQFADGSAVSLEGARSVSNDIIAPNEQPWALQLAMTANDAAASLVIPDSHASLLISRRHAYGRRLINLAPRRCTAVARS